MTTRRVRQRVVPRTERGSGTLLTMAVAVLILAGAFAAVLWITVLAAKHRAATAADLASLSAANALQTTESTESACETAARIAAEHRAALAQCTIGQATEVVVVTSVQLHLGKLGSPTITATSRAGPIASESGDQGRPGAASVDGEAVVRGWRRWMEEYRWRGD